MNFRKFPIRVLARKRYDQLVLAEKEKIAWAGRFSFLEKFPDPMAGFFLKNLSRSHAQLHQDLFILWESKLKRNGYFVEIGACDGVLFSNTLLLEKEYGWSGILVEPARCWWDDLKQNRKSIIVHDFISAQSGGRVLFNEAAHPEFSGAHKFIRQDHHAEKRAGGREYPVPTLSLGDLLELRQAPREIDFLSIDVEGGEYEILASFDFERYRIHAIFCEHNYTPQRIKIQQLLAQKGYIRRHESFSQFDDWYFLKED